MLLVTSSQVSKSKLGYRNLGVIFYTQINFEKHLNQTIKSSSFQLRNTAKLCHLLSFQQL